MPTYRISIAQPVDGGIGISFDFAHYHIIRAESGILVLRGICPGNGHCKKEKINKKS